MRSRLRHTKKPVIYNLGQAFTRTWPDFQLCMRPINENVVQPCLNNENIPRLVGHNYTAGSLDLHSAFQRVTEVEDDEEDDAGGQIETDNKAVREEKIGGEEDGGEEDGGEGDGGAGDGGEGEPMETE